MDLKISRNSRNSIHILNVLHVLIFKIYEQELLLGNDSKELLCPFS